MEEKKIIKFKPGKKPPNTKGALKYSKYVNRDRLPALPALPYGHGDICTAYQMFGNDVEGDCVIAGFCNAEELYHTIDGNAITLNTDIATKTYGAFCGYDPNNPNSDNGCEIANALHCMQATGIIDGNGKVHKIDAFLNLDHTNLQEILEAVYYFDVVKIGIQLPQSAEDQFNAGQPWTVVEGSPNLGGHDVEIVKAQADGTLLVVTWGKLQVMTQEFFLKYCDEAWAVLSQEMLTAKGISLEGFNFAQLQVDLAALNSAPQPPQPAPPITGTIAGCVIASGAPVIGATVQVQAHDSVVLQNLIKIAVNPTIYETAKNILAASVSTVTTDHLGNYSVTVVAGTYDVSVSAPNYLPTTAPPIVIVTAGQMETQNFTLSPIPAPTPPPSPVDDIVGDLVQDLQDLLEALEGFKAKKAARRRKS